MDSRLEAHIDEIFKDVPKTEKLVVMINRIKSKANAKYLQVREQGYSRNVAYTEVENWITKAKVIVDEEVKNYRASQAGTAVASPTSAPAVPAPLNVQNINDRPAVVVERTTPQDKPKQAPAPITAPIPAPVAAPIPAPVAPAQKNISHAAPVSNDELSDILGKKKVKDKKAEKPEKDKKAEKPEKVKKEKANKANAVSTAPVDEVEAVEEPIPFIAPIEPTPSFPSFVAPLPTSTTPSFQVPVAKYEEPVNLAEETISAENDTSAEDETVEQAEENQEAQTVCPTETSEYRCKGVVGKIFGAVAILLGLGAAVLVIMKFLG